MEISIISALIAGFLMFFMPCTFPLVPIFLSTITGLNISELSNKNSRQVKSKIILNSLFFVLGFSFVFTVLGLFSSLLIQNLGPSYRFNIGKIGGIIVIIFGLFIVLNQTLFTKRAFSKSKYVLTLQKTFKLKDRDFKASFLGSFLVGATFAFGWTPCIGPILGSVLAIASTSDTVIRGTFLLLIFSTGLAIPFMTIATLTSYGVNTFVKFKKFSKFLPVVSIITGFFLVFIGILLLTGEYYRLSGLFFNNSLQNFGFFRSLLDYF